MKLLSNYYRTTIIATIVIVILSSFAYFFIIHYILIEQLDDTLKVEEQEVIDHVREKGVLPEPSNYMDQQVIFKPATNDQPIRSFSTVKFYSKEDTENISARQLVFSIQVNQKPWLVYVIKSQEETEDLVQLILMITLVIVTLLLLILFLINRFVLQRLWKPFHSTLVQLKKFNLSGKMKLNLETTHVDEFKELNDAVKIMTDHVADEYNSLKNFTDNASHELQTPLAIINSKLDLLIQDDSISENQMDKLQFIYDALNKMSRMNHSLLLLARIENKQFNKTESIALDQTIEEKLQLFEDVIFNRQLIVNKNIQPLKLQGNKYLLDILLSNLINNAINYCNAGGSISITLKNNELVISNTSSIPGLDTQKVFQRFYRHEDTNKDGNGLGLSIIKQICMASGYSFDYSFNNGFHHFRLGLN